ncbi:hypothetical protein JCM3775_005555 [Rhodotorula graminis]
MSAALLPRGCTCLARLPSLSRASFSTSTPSLAPPTSRPAPRPPRARPGPDPSRVASSSEPWQPHNPSRAPQPLPSRLSPQKRFAQDRERERLKSANLDKPRWRADPRAADRLARSAASVALDVGEIGASLPQQRERSRRFRAREEEAEGGDGGGSSRGQRAGAPRRGGGGGGGAGGAAAAPERMVPGRVNRSLQRNRDEVRVSNAPAPAPPPRHQPSKRAKSKPKQLKKVVLPTTLRLDNLVNILKERLSTVQRAAEGMGLTDTRPDRLLTSEDASLLALELGFDPEINDDAAFDLFPLPLSPPELLSPRPPITGIFGHVDHGKTSLLDALRSTSVAAGEAGGITQHIGAFEVGVASMVANLRARADKNNNKKPSSPASSPKKDVVAALKEGEPTITFLDTPGHAAFTAMRSRGAGVTDVVVLVVAADDGVKPQTEEVIGLIRSASGELGVVVALTKCDKPGVDTTKVKHELMAAGVEVEDFGGDVPCVEVSSVTGQGLAELVETISAIAEVRELKAERAGRVEGRVIESRVEKGRGNVATVLVLRGCLRNTASLVAGTTWARVRTLIPPSGKAVVSAYPGQPVEVTGWKDLPAAGDLVLEAATEDEAKRAIANRLRRVEQEKLWSDVEVINEKQRREAEILAIRKDEEDKAKAKGLRGNAVLHAGDAAVEELVGASDGPKELLLVIKADVSGTVEAVVGALEGIGNAEAKVKILSSAVGPVTQGDVDMARAVGATIVGFNVKAPGSVMKDAAKVPNPVPVHTSPIIYRLVDTVRQATADLLPKSIETRVHGEATVQMVFDISVKGRKEPKRIAGSKVSNGVFQKARKARVVRKGEVLHTGVVSTLKQVKKDVLEIPKGVECGIALDDFDAWEVDDLIQSVEEVEVARTL